MNDKIKQIIDVIALNRNDENTGLLSGQSGNAVFYYYCSLCINNDYEANCIQNIEATLIKINNGNKTSTFCSGMASFGWTLEFLKAKEIFTDEDIELLDDLDDYLYKNMIAELNVGDYDYLHGAIGYGLYFLKRLHKTESVSYLAELVHHIERLAEKDTDGCFKWESIIEHEKGEKGYNISLSHGMASIVAILTKIYNADIEKEKCKQLITGAVNYILAQEIDKNKYGSFFPYTSIESSTELSGSRLAWCYGDMGVAMAIWQAGRAFNNSSWTDKAMEVLLYATTRRDLETNLVVDAGLCHGTAGIGHIFYRMYWNTKLPAFKDAADYWFDETLKMARFEDGLAGYKAWHPTENDGWVNEASVLEGIVGIGLALLSYHYNIEPSWDECLLLS